MKTLKDHTILYDEVCPMCQLYTSAFVRAGMLDGEGRFPYQQLAPDWQNRIDCARARNEIALVNRRTGEVSYGVHSLFRILEHSWPRLRVLFRWKPFAGAMTCLYRFISYNRRVIMPSASSAAETEPSFHRGWRLAYLGFAWIVTALVLHGYGTLLTPLLPRGTYLREFLVCGGQIPFQLAVLALSGKGRRWDYLGSLMMVSLAGALALLTGLLLAQWVSLPPTVWAGAFLLVAGLMFLEHMRRVRILGLGALPSLSWLAYRLLLLIILL